VDKQDAFAFKMHSSQNNDDDNNSWHEFSNGENEYDDGDWDWNEDDVWEEDEDQEEGKQEEEEEERTNNGGRGAQEKKKKKKEQEEEVIRVDPIQEERHHRARLKYGRHGGGALQCWHDSDPMAFVEAMSWKGGPDSKARFLLNHADNLGCLNLGSLYSWLDAETVRTLPKPCQNIPWKSGVDEENASAIVRCIDEIVKDPVARQRFWFLDVQTVQNDNRPSATF
jgi:hypothetical protein